MLLVVGWFWTDCFQISILEPHPSPSYQVCSQACRQVIVMVVLQMQQISTLYLRVSKQLTRVRQTDTPPLHVIIVHSIVSLPAAHKQRARIVMELVLEPTLQVPLELIVKTPARIVALEPGPPPIHGMQTQEHAIW